MHARCLSALGGTLRRRLACQETVFRIAPTTRSAALRPARRVADYKQSNTAKSVDSMSSEVEAKKRGRENVPEATPEASTAQPDSPQPKKAARAGKGAKAKKSQASDLPTEPVGERYEETMRPEKLTSGCRTIMSWNVAGLRALVKKDPDALKKLIDREQPDILCLQETKLQDKHTADMADALALDGWSVRWNCSGEKAGYSGVACLYRQAAFDTKPTVTKGIGTVEHDREGRVLTLETADMFVVNVYVPNSGDGLKRLDYRIHKWDVAFAAYLDSLRQRKPVVLTGDLNCARHPIDIHNAKRNLKSAGFTPEERASFQKLLMDGGWTDTFREQHPDVHGYTYYGYRQNMRAKKKGWRLDYFLTSEHFKGKCHDSFILPDFLGSDHCPIGLTVTI